MVAPVPPGDRVLLLTTGKVTAEEIPPAAPGVQVVLNLDNAAIDHLRGHAEDEFAAVTIIASTWARLRAALAPLRLLGTTTDVTVRVLREVLDTGRAPVIGAVPRTRVVHFSSTTSKRGGTTIETRLSRAAPVHDVVRSMSGQTPRLFAPGLRVALADREAERFIIGSLDLQYVGVDDVIEAGGITLPMAEIVAAGSQRPPGDERPQVCFADAAPLGDPKLAVPAVDTAVVNPIGFVSSDSTSDGRVEVAGSGHLILRKDDGSSLGRIPRDGLLSGPLIRRLRGLRAITADRLPPSHDLAAATLLSQLGAAGVLLVINDPSDGLTQALGAEFTRAMAAISPATLADPVQREGASIRLRREAIRQHGAAWRWREIGRRLQQPIPDPPLVSVVLTTRRPHLVVSAVTQIARQSYPKLEVILGLHGGDFDASAVKEALDGTGLPHTVVQTPSDVPFGTALNRAFALCTGRLVTKWDDDDLYGIEHLWDLVLAAEYSGADVVGKAAEFTLLEEIGVTVRRNAAGGERFTRHVAGGTILMRRETLDAVGGWRPVVRSVDGILLRQVLAAGGTVYRTHGFGYVLRRHTDGHTWNPATGADYFLEGEGHQWPVDSPLQRLVLDQSAIPD